MVGRVVAGGPALDLGGRGRFDADDAGEGRSTSRMMHGAVVKGAVTTTRVTNRPRLSRRGRRMPRAATVMTRVARRNQRMVLGVLAVAWVSRSPWPS
ncbi:hypothetical protein [Streptomyces cremeus]|uniref:Uncharacterized protein n=1 Tax=Streptomyces cremeus TaxID=66881 RepID=A0ABV5PLN9_STRCM